MRTRLAVKPRYGASTSFSGVLLPAEITPVVFIRRAIRIAAGVSGEPVGMRPKNTAAVRFESIRAATASPSS